MNSHFPFGCSLVKVEQKDRSPKQVFVLGVYASAVHAQWLDQSGKIKVRALAVASEPYIFWKGDGADRIIESIHVPSELGTLKPAEARFNGPSGKELDRSILGPLGFSRSDSWLSDLLPYARLNPNQQEAIRSRYEPIVEIYGLPDCTIPEFDKNELNDPKRATEIIQELEESGAKKLILLGDLPIKWSCQLSQI